MHTSGRFSERLAVRVGAGLLVLVAGLTCGVAPAGAARPPSGGTSSASVTVDGNCLATVNYSWSGFRGKNLVAEYELVDHTGTSLDLGIAFGYDSGVLGASGGGSKSFQLTAGGTSPVTRFAAIGRLGKFDHSGQFSETIPDAKAQSLGPSNPAGCGFPIQ